jgi:hemoglobin-like flavoprotein
MTYFYAQLFAMDTEIRAMFPAAMDVQRRRFFQALSHIAAAQEGQKDRDSLVPYLQELGRAHRNSASGTTRCSGAPCSRRCSGSHGC